MPQLPLTDAPFRKAIEQWVTRQVGRPWAVKTAQDLADFASHPAALLSDGAYGVFAKFSAAANGSEQFEIELASLQLLAERAGVLIPTPIGIVPVPGGSLLILEAIPLVERTPRHWRQIGQTLARLHRVKSSQFGLATPGYFGPVYQDNTPAADWPTFYAERRLWPGVQLAAAHLPATLIKQIEYLITRLPELCGPAVQPTLLHGDAQQNNFLSAANGTYVIDPAVYFGHPEMDLAYVDYFQPVPVEVFAGYQEEWPIEAGFWERRPLWRLWGYLAAVAVEGASYLGALTTAVQHYV